jgi:hypothetical protein
LNTIDEVRAMENWNPVPGGDRRALSQNLRLLDANGNDPEPVASSGKEPTTTQ